MTIYTTDFKAIGGPTTDDMKVVFKKLQEYKADHNGKLPDELFKCDILVDLDNLKISFVDLAKKNDMGMVHDGIPMSVYSGVLYWFLTNKKVNRWIDGRVIDGTQYIRDYANGFMQGVNEFKSKHYVSNPYGLTDPHSYALELVNKYLNKNTGWINIIKSYPNPITKESITDYGCRSGILEQMELFVSEYPVLFKPHFAKIDQLDNKDLSHREVAIIGNFLIEANYQKHYENLYPHGWTNEIRQKYGQGRLEAIYSVNKRSSKFRPIKKHEIENIIPHLKSYPDALKNARKQLSESLVN